MGNPKTQKPESGIQKPESEIRNLESTNQRKQVHQIPEKYFAWLLLVKMKRASKKDLKHFFFFLEQGFPVCRNSCNRYLS